MKTSRPISINNSLVHGICNYSCRLCGINQPGYNGPREYQSLEVTQTLIHRIREAADSGVYTRYVANAGDGEPTLHPDFCNRMGMFGRMLCDWDNHTIAPPEISVVTNGSHLHAAGIMESFLDNNISLIISFPTSRPESYGMIMTGDPGRGEELLSRVKTGIERAMSLAAEHRLSSLSFHISPPEIGKIRRDFPGTIDWLTRRAAESGLGKIRLVLFPATSNRSGLIRSGVVSIDMYTDLFRQYNNQVVNGVVIEMKRVVQRFFERPGEVVDLVMSFRFPCLWNANFFIAANGSSICCNDQSISNPLGNIIHDSLASLMEKKEQFWPGSMCGKCNQAPQRLRGSIGALIYSRVARLRMGLAAIRNKPDVDQGVDACDGE